MSDTKQTRKKNKKKKSNPNLNGNADTPVNSAAVTKSEVPKLDTIIDGVLPQKVGMTTKFKDVEVTMTNSGSGSTNCASKKKKKKKKAKQPCVEGAEEPSPNETENKNLLNFSENHIELVNHPEISVTISTNTDAVQVKEPPKCQEKVSPVSEKNGQSDVADDKSTISKKKKKKKKKKKTNSNSTTVPSDPSEIAEDSHSTPTYVKLPADGDNCVLLVSHESFSNGNRPIHNSNSDAQTKTPTVVLKKTETNETIKNASPIKSTVQNGSSVSIFPVYSDPNTLQDKNPEFNVASSLDKISDVIKQESTDSMTKVCSTPDVSIPNATTKAQLKAERRAKQEAQRAAKLAKNTETSATQIIAEQGKDSATSKEQLAAKQNSIENNISCVNKNVPKTSVEREVCRKVQIFSHLPQYQELLSKQLINNYPRIPSSILELGSHYCKGTLCGSNARCVGFLGAFRKVIMDYKTPSNKVLSRDLECKLQTYLEFLGNCRPLSVSIVNAMKFLKHQINHIPEGMSDERAKESLSQSINNYVREEILLAKEAITISASAKIVNDDTILVFAYSSLVKDVLCKAHDQKKTFHVIVVDSRAKLEGLEMLRRLVKHGLHCSYISINAVSSVIKKVNKVMIGAHALLANGYVMSRLGCKILSLVCSTYSVPVLVCCETYKFWERALTDSIVHNELGNPDDLVTISLDKKDSLAKWHDLSSLQIYNLLYDVTPSDFISVVITEKGLIPCTSVPVLLRVKHAGLQE